MKPRAHGFTLIELLVTMSIIAVLAILVARIAPGALSRSKETISLNNLRQIGIAFQLYAADNDGRLPQRVTTSDKWPFLLNEYLKTPKVYADPSDTESYLINGEDPLSNSSNHTSYIMNGYNDLGAFSDETVIIKIANIATPSQVILAAIQLNSSNFYMDFEEGNHASVLNKTAYRDGSVYLFTDGSSRFLKQDEYEDRLWLINPEYQIPTP